MLESIHEGLSTRLIVSKDAQMTSPLRSGKTVSALNRNNVVEFPVGQLQPDTQYYYALEVNGVLDRTKRGQFRTFPAPGPASFEIALASCARTGSTRNVFDRIRDHHPLFYMNMGDLHYQDINQDQPELFRAAYDSVLGSPQQAELYRSVPFVYMWDDHDYGGNSATRKVRIHSSARRTYDEYVPHYPFADTSEKSPIAQAFTVGRVRFILTDLRSERDDPGDKDDEKKSMLGDSQKEWFKQELLAANGRYPVICWVSTVPWIGVKGANPYTNTPANRFGWIHHTNLIAKTESTNATQKTNSEHATGLEESDQVLVWQSSLLGDLQAGKAVDHNAGSFSHTDDRPDSYWMADLGRATPLEKIEIVNRRDCCAERLEGLVLRLYDASSNSISSVTLSNVGAGGTFEYAITPATEVRWFRIGLEEGKRNGGKNFFVTLAEVRAYSEGSNVLESAVGLTLAGGNANQLMPVLRDNDRDDWSAYATERREIADFIKANRISGFMIVHGDSHMLAADDGTDSDYATGGGVPIPVICAGPLDQNPSIKGGPYSQGVYRVRDKEGESGFGLIKFDDKGNAIDVTYSGRNNKDQEKISLKFTVPVPVVNTAQRK